MGTSKLALYNGALHLLGERKLASLSEAREPRRVLDDRYDMAVAEALEAGQWHFAMRSVRLDSAPDIDVAFGWQFGFTKPTDWVRTAAISASETFEPPLIRFVDEGDTWLADTDPIYVKYVSSGLEFGMDLARWPASFARYVEAQLALLVCERLTQNQSKEDRLERLVVPRARRNALNKDAMSGPTPKFMPTGRLVASRGNGGIGRRYDRG